jgi:hypothetical protein
LPTTPERIVIGELPSLPIPRDNAGASLLAHIMVSKYVDHLPFYRQKKIFRRQDIDISQSTINDWFSASCKLLEPLYEVLRKRVQTAGYLMADETPIPVLTKDRPGSAHKGYFWVYYDPLGGTACFDYRSGRGREGPNEFLKNFKGALQTDGYVAYDIYEKKNRMLPFWAAWRMREENLNMPWTMTASVANMPWSYLENSMPSSEGRERRTSRTRIERYCEKNIPDQYWIP